MPSLLMKTVLLLNRISAVFSSNIPIIMMGSIEENRYRYNIDTTQISFQTSPSQTSHLQISQVFRLSDFEFFRFLQHFPRFPVIFILDFFAIFGNYFSDDTKYLNKISVLNNTKGIDPVSILFRIPLFFSEISALTVRGLTRIDVSIIIYFYVFNLTTCGCNRMADRASVYRLLYIWT